MDALGALVGLGVLGSILEGVSDADMVRKATTPAEGAKAAKEIYDSYVAAGFNEVQAFELLKAVLTAHKN